MTKVNDEICEKLLSEKAKFLKQNKDAEALYRKKISEGVDPKDKSLINLYKIMENSKQKYEEVVSYYNEYATRYKQVSILESPLFKSKEDKKALRIARENLSIIDCELSEKYLGIKKRNFKEKRKIKIGISVAAIIAALVILVSSCSANKDKKDANVSNPQTTVEQTTEPIKTAAPTEKPVNDEDDLLADASLYLEGYTNAKDTVQVNKQANYYYSEYINKDNVPDTFKRQLDVEAIANTLRMNGGEFKEIDGEKTYNSEHVDETANNMYEIANSTSFKQYGTDLQFRPMAELFEKGTDARFIVEQADALMKKVYEDIKNNDQTAFKEDSIKWGEFVRDTFVYNDSTGKVMSIWSLDSEEPAYFVAKAITSYYAPSIFEYANNIDLANGKETYGICIPFCYDDKGNLKEVPLSQLIYDLNYTPMNHLAVKAGMEDSWKEIGEPVMVQLWNNQNEYFLSKYDIEIGRSKSYTK